MREIASEMHSHVGDYDVVVVGAGIVGSMIARDLSRYEGRLALVDKEPFSGFGVSKGSLSMVHSPSMWPPGALRTKLTVEAPTRYRKLADELDVVFRDLDELYLALEPSHVPKLEEMKRRGEEYGSLRYEIIGPKKIHELEPHLTKKVVAALYIRGLGTIYPPEWTFALSENAVQNHVHLHLSTTVMDIKREGNGVYLLHTSKGNFRARYVVNSAGLFADEIAHMVGDHDIRLSLTKGTMAILDNAVSHLVRHMIYGTFSKEHSQVIAPTAHGNLMVGLGYFTKPEHKGDTVVTRDKLQEVMRMGRELVPALSEKDIITSFAGIRSENSKASNGDFYIAPSEHAPGVIHAIIGSPGLTDAPGIAESVIILLRDAGMEMVEKRSFRRKRVGWPRFSTAPPEQRREMIASNPAYGHIVCRCEEVTEGEITEAIRRGANTLDAVKHLTRAGMGRCQGGFCGVPVLNLLTRERNLPQTLVTKKGKGSHQVTGFVRERGAKGLPPER